MQEQKRIPVEGDVISQGNLPAGKKYVIENEEEIVEGIKKVTVTELDNNGEYHSSAKKSDLIVIESQNRIMSSEVKFHNKMKKKFISKCKNN